MPAPFPSSSARPTLIRFPEEEAHRDQGRVVQVLCDRLGGLSRREAAKHVDDLFALMKEVLGGGEKLKVSGFGKFDLRDKHARPGRNPQTGENIEISGRRVVTFKASLMLRGRLNSGDVAEDVGADEDWAGGVVRRG